ncbi:MULTISPECIES: hypothetical protein [unclassified Novosphingobium]|uniref:hypothetical protein n=1 Tax=unclassified Novosphingobium TaxID=2644732 RepID=UPI000D40AF0E|nr:MULTISPECIES: hypothetical protein [unclassified Novosphingobium]PTR07898.1 hypothetical protein C8K11_113109 [Novosphingobium sp. GV055]PUB00711.1 hypothetical protein C8K12_113109 [Novosphingobium sp. GV061]PUB16120.1 hypothetical protein C8K14_113109 [Novosphingobium sp. GV079]PUB39585.1 hypothetical protein C8K10_113109 [Novosphingobium sp. GV027]
MLALAILGGTVSGVLAACIGAVVFYCLKPGRQPDAETLARVIAQADGSDFDETCGLEADQDDCNSATCIACDFEDHDPEWARTVYLRRAEAVLMHLARW